MGKPASFTVDFHGRGSGKQHGIYITTRLNPAPP
jgi:hypothetical protein